MKYRIMTVVENKPNNASSYEFYKKKDDEGFMRVFETDDKSSLANEVETMLNTKGKNEIIVVSILDYNLDTDIADSDSFESNSTTDNDDVNGDL